MMYHTLAVNMAERRILEAKTLRILLTQRRVYLENFASLASELQSTICKVGGNYLITTVPCELDRPEAGPASQIQDLRAITGLWHNPLVQPAAKAITYVDVPVLFEVFPTSRFESALSRPERVFLPESPNLLDRAHSSASACEGIRFASRPMASGT